VRCDFPGGEGCVRVGRVRADRDEHGCLIKPDSPIRVRVVEVAENDIIAEVAQPMSLFESGNYQ
jgi:hypothetical protein